MAPSDNFDGLAADLATRVQGRVCTSEDPAYQDATRVWNARLQRHPGIVASCTSAADVREAVRFGRAHGLQIAVKSGGHDYAGNSTCDGGLLLDLSGLADVEVDPGARVARVGPGAVWGDVDAATQEHGLATPGGTVSTVGVAGFTLGGGSGHLTRRYGLALDNLLAVDVVTADGESVRAEAGQNEDLFWAVRGGGGNFGVVTRLEFRLHEVGPELLSGQIVFPLDSAAVALRRYREIMATAPDELTCYPFFFRVPPIDAFPEPLHGDVVISLVVSWSGDVEDGAAVLAAFDDIGEPILKHVVPQPFVEVQRSFDDGVPKGLRWYSRSHYLADLPDDAIAAFIESVRGMVGEFTMAYLEPQGGEVGRIPVGATAFPHRDARHSFHVLTGWAAESDDASMMEWTRSVHTALEPYSTGGVYVNLLGEDEEERVPSAYGTNLDRLRRIKARWDPDNVFRTNHNIPPAD